MNRKRLIPLIVPLIALLLNEIFLLYPKLFFVCLSFGVLTLFLGVKFLGQGNNKRFWPFFSILPIIVFLSFSLYSALISSKLFIQLFFFASFVINFYYFRLLYYFLTKEDDEKAEQLSSFSVFAGFFSVFCIYSSIYLLPFFINLSPFFLALFPILIVWFLFFKATYFYLKSFSQSSLVLIINTLILLQISLIVSYLPLSAHILGFIISLTYYLLLIISILNFRDKINRRSLKWPLILVLISALALLLTARWI